MIQVTENTITFAYQRKFYRKKPLTSAESFLIMHFDLNQTGKQCSQKIGQFRIFGEGAHSIFSLNL